MDHKKKEAIEKYARLGMAAKGAVYVLVGTLTAMAAFGEGGKVTGKTGAFQTVLSQPFGKVLLGIIAFGLIGYAVWRFYQSFKDPQNKGDDSSGKVKLVGYAISGLIYLSLAVYAFTLVFSNSGGGGNSKQTLVAKLLEQPFGQWLVGLVAAGIIIKGAYQLYRAFTEDYMKEVGSGLEHRVRSIIRKAGKVGFTARGVVLGIVGYFFIRAAIQSNPSQAGGTGQAFEFLQNTGGTILLAVVAIGLAAYGVFMFVKARYTTLNIQ